MKNLIKVAILMSLIACGSNPVFDISSQKNSTPGVSYNNKIDVLWVIDSSGTMDADRAKLANHIQYMFSVLDSKKLDYRMSAVTMDMSTKGDENYRNGKFVGSTKVIDINTRNKANVFASMLGVPASATAIERGRDAVKTALSPAMLAGVNTGFLRSDALLVLIFVSDENDESASSKQSAYDFLNALKPRISENRLGWMANFVGVLDEACRIANAGTSSDIGFDYIDMVEQSSGSMSSICEGDLSQAVENIQRRIVSVVTSIELKQPPVIESIVVKFDGVIVEKSETNGWSFDEESNSVIFHGDAIPASDILIDIVYKPRDLRIDN